MWDFGDRLIINSGHRHGKLNEFHLEKKNKLEKIYRIKFIV